MPAVRIYTDESVHVSVATGLRRRGVDAWSARDAGKLGISDQDQLAYARAEQAILFTHDDDFLRLATDEGAEHWGIIYTHKQNLSVGECIRRLLEYALLLEADDMRNEVEFL